MRYGLRPDFDAEEYREERTARFKKFEQWSIITIYSVPPVVVLFAQNLFENSTKAQEYSIYGILTNIALILLISFMSPVILIGVLAGHWVKKLAPRLTSTPYIRTADEYLADLEKWKADLEKLKDDSLETGYNFWREKRGVQFEIAVQRLFCRRGVAAEVTKATGDGGIDIIIPTSTGPIWGQCKGHAAPIGVKVVREIAGSCIASGARAAIFAVNGYTQPARDAAGRLNVTLYDVSHLVRFAHMQRITEFSAPQQTLAR